MICVMVWCIYLDSLNENYWIDFEVKIKFFSRVDFLLNGLDECNFSKCRVIGCRDFLNFVVGFGSVLLVERLVEKDIVLVVLKKDFFLKSFVDEKRLFD